MNLDIDYGLIGRAVDRYKALGYSYLETPWWVSERAVSVTLPEGIDPFVIDPSERNSQLEGYSDNYLVGSAEQALIQFILDRRIKPGLYVMAGPCFRNEPVDELHHQSFFKVELASVFIDGVPQRDEMMMMRDVQVVTSSLFNVIPSVVHMVDGAGYDLEVSGVEVGSYGRRSLNGVNWVYGTGLALPRFTQAMAETRRA